MDSFFKGMADSPSARPFIMGAGLVLTSWQLTRMLFPVEPELIKAPILSESADYPSNFYPGGRDIPTPYGKIRAYEFGPEKGKRVLFVHGITTPCPVFTGILSRMTEAGYRVCTFDLWGRGYSDSPDLKHDARLYTTQILAVLKSVGWTQCSFVGYSLGGGIVSSFASHFPETVESLIIIAPAGLLARKNLSAARKIAMSENAPVPIIRILQKLVVPGPKEIKENVAGGRVDVSKVTMWQAANHAGFERSYLSSFRFAPIFDQWELYARLRDTNLEVHALWGGDDDIVNTKFVSSNLQRAISKVKLTIIPGVGHDICTAMPIQVFEYIKNILQSG